MVYVLLGTGFEEVEAITPVDLLRRAGIEVKTVGITGKTVYGSHNIGIEADILPEEIDFDALDMIVLPGGLGGVASARASQAALDALKWAWDNGRFVAAICCRPYRPGRPGHHRRPECHLLSRLRESDGQCTHGRRCRRHP